MALTSTPSTGVPPGPVTVPEMLAFGRAAAGAAETPVSARTEAARTTTQRGANRADLVLDVTSDRFMSTPGSTSELSPRPQAPSRHRGLELSSPAASMAPGARAHRVFTRAIPRYRSGRIGPDDPSAAGPPPQPRRSPPRRRQTHRPGHAVRRLRRLGRRSRVRALPLSL